MIHHYTFPSFNIIACLYDVNYFLNQSVSKVEVLSLNLKGESVLDHKEFHLYPGCDDQGLQLRNVAH